MAVPRSRVTNTLYRALLRAGKKWVVLNERAQDGPREAQTFLQDIAFRSVKANSTSWASSLLSGMKELYEADLHLSHSCEIAGEKGSANYFGLDGLRREFRREVADEADLNDRIDRAFETLKWLGLGNKFAEAIYDSLEPRQKPQQIEFSVGDILYHKQFGWRGVVYGWAEQCEMGEDWLAQNDALDKKDFPFYNLLCNDGKFRYGSQLTHVRVEGPLEFLPSVSPSDLSDARRHLEMYFHAFSDSEGAYIPNSHLARRFVEPRWQVMDREGGPSAGLESLDDIL